MTRKGSINHRKVTPTSSKADKDDNDDDDNCYINANHAFEMEDQTPVKTINMKTNGETDLTMLDAADTSQENMYDNAGYRPEPEMNSGSPGYHVNKLYDMY